MKIISLHVGIQQENVHQMISDVLVPLFLCGARYTLGHEGDIRKRISHLLVLTLH